MRILFTTEEQNEVIVYFDDGSVGSFPFPPQSEDHKKLVEDHGGIDAIKRDSHEDLLEMERRADIEEVIDMVDAAVLSRDVINVLLAIDLDRSDLLKYKMKIFTEEEIINCKDKELLTKLRKAPTTLETVTYYGMIKLGIKEAE